LRQPGIVRTFQTRQVFDPRGFVRTFGTVVEAGTGPLRFRPGDAIRHAPRDAPEGCARGKVAALSRDGDAACYQISDCRTRARIVGCCNGAAAVAAAHAERTDLERIRVRVALPGGRRVRVDARVDRGAVEQTWRAIPFPIRAASVVDGRECAASSGPLNDYLVVRTRPGEDPAAFPVGEAARS
jgi:hypothetical protein